MIDIKPGGLKFEALRTYVLVGLSLSIGWGIRGNFGHGWGAALPGALAAMAAVLISGRSDWMRRISFFGMFGAVGWAVGGTMAYMVVIAYTHSGHSSSVLYGFFCLFVIGFLWGAIGGAGTVLPAYLTRERLQQFFVPFAMLFISWWADSLFEGNFIDNNPRFKEHSPLDWFDTTWTAALLTLLMIGVRGAIRRRFDFAEKLLLWMATGWFAGFFIITNVLHLYMAPGKGEDWAGVFGMTIAMLIYFYRNGLKGVVWASLMTGALGGLGFATGVLFKLIELKTGWTTNWHSVLEQTYGLFNGLAIAFVVIRVRRAAAPVDEGEQPDRRFDAVAVSFLLLLLTYMNVQKEVDDWIHGKTMPEAMYFMSSRGWFDLFYVGIALTGIYLLREHLKRPFTLVPTSWMGKAQMLYLTLLWWMVTANFMKALGGFSPQRLITEGVITFHALLCTIFVLTWGRDVGAPKEVVTPDYGKWIERAVAVGAAIMVLAPIFDWAIVRAIYGGSFAGYAGHHYRFGPKAVKARE